MHNRYGTSFRDDMDTHSFLRSMSSYRNGRFAGLRRPENIHEGDHIRLLEVGHGVDQDGNFPLWKDRSLIIHQTYAWKLGNRPMAYEGHKG